MDEATPEMIAMARRICAKCAGDAGTINRPIAPRFLAGELDDHPAMLSALAAIIETTKRAAVVVREYAAEAQDSYHRRLGENAAEALLCGDHYGKDSE